MRTPSRSRDFCSGGKRSFQITAKRGTEITRIWRKCFHLSVSFANSSPQGEPFRGAATQISLPPGGRWRAIARRKRVEPCIFTLAAFAKFSPLQSRLRRASFPTGGSLQFLHLRFAFIAMFPFGPRRSGLAPAMGAVQTGLSCLRQFTFRWIARRARRRGLLASNCPFQWSTEKTT